MGDRMSEINSPPDPENGKSLARVQAVPWLLFILLLALCAWLAQKAFWDQPDGNPLGTTLIAFEKQNSLTVFSAQLAPVVAANDSRYLGTITSRQVAVIPARVDYKLDLSSMNANRLAWDGKTETLTVRLPQVAVGKPNLDEARAQYFREGIWITRDAQESLSRKNTRLAEKQALEQANSPVLMGLARGAAKDAIRQNLAIPLAVAGFDNVTVTVRFDEEKETP